MPTLFKHHVLKHDSRIEGDGTVLKIKQGYNSVNDKYFISITDRKTLITLRINMTEEFFKNFHNMGHFTMRQTLHDKELKQDSASHTES